MGFWIVISVVTGAIVTLVLSLMADADADADNEAPAPPAQPPTPAPKPVTWAILAASDADVQDQVNYGLSNWVELVTAQLPPHVQVVNSAIGGATLATARAEQVERALAAEPEIVTIWLAVNDLFNGVPLPSYVADLDALLTELSAEGRQLFIGNVPDVSQFPAAAQLGVPTAALHQLVQAWNEQIAALAAAHGATVIDFSNLGEGVAEPNAFLAADGFHPNQAGHRLLAERFGPAVASALTALQSSS